MSPAEVLNRVKKLTSRSPARSDASLMESVESDEVAEMVQSAQKVTDQYTPLLPQPPCSGFGTRLSEAAG